MVKSVFLAAVITLFLAVGLSAQGEMKPAPTKGKVVVVITHEVKEYASWRKAFNADASNRKAAGFKVMGVYSDVNNPNRITIIGEFPSAAAAEAFSTSPKLKEVMEKAGVIGQPDVKVLTARPK